MTFEVVPAINCPCSTLMNETQLCVGFWYSCTCFQLNNLIDHQ